MRRQANAMELHYHESGTGAPLIVLHGLFGSLDNWRPVSRLLSDRFRIIAVDQRNHGRSPHASDMNLREMAKDLRGLMDRLELGRAHLLGHSMGGKTAMQFALLHPEQVDRLVIADVAPVRYEPSHRRLMEAMMALDTGSISTRAEADAELGRSIPDPAVRQFLLKSLARDGSGRFHWRLNLPALRQNYDLLLAPPEMERPCERPALFLCGDDSDYVKDTDISEVRRFFPRAEFERVPGTGHWLHAEKPETVADAIRRFLQKDF
jgi:esterase